MKNLIKTIIISIISLNCLLGSLSFGYTVELPDAKNSDIKELTTTITTVSVDDRFKKIYLNTTNKYVWIIAGVVCMGVIIFAGVSLITSEGDDQQLKNANKTLVYGLVGIVLSLGAYVIINVIINLF